VAHEIILPSKLVMQAHVARLYSASS